MLRQTYTTEAADRLLGLADQFLEEWAEDTIQSGEPDPDYKQRQQEWELYRPLFLRAPRLLEALELAITAMSWTPSFDTGIQNPERPKQNLSSYQLLPQLEALVGETKGDTGGSPAGSQKTRGDGLPPGQPEGSQNKRTPS